MGKQVLTITTRRVLLVMLMPALCMALALLFAKELHRLVSFNVILPYLPYMLILAGLGLSWGFNNGREFNLLLVAGIIYWVLRDFIWAPNLPIPAQSLLFALLTALAPINFLTHDLLMERGVLRWQVVKRLSITLGQIALIAAVLLLPNNVMQEGLRVVLWNNPWPQYVLLPQVGIIAAALTLAVMIGHFVMQPNILRGGNIMAFVAVMLALNTIEQPAVCSVFFSIATGAILIAIVLNSYNLAYMDELTNLPSRRALKQHLLALGKNYCIAMLDIDHFKKLNDTYGHDVGDQVLRMVAAQLNTVGGNGKAFRYGGEEFTILFPNQDVRDALGYVDEVRALIAKTPFVLRHRKRPRSKPEQPQHRERVEKISVTISAGITQRNPDRHTGPQDVIKSADKALYTAKRAGRNRVHAL